MTLEQYEKLQELRRQLIALDDVVDDLDVRQGLQNAIASLQHATNRALMNAAKRSMQR